MLVLPHILPCLSSHNKSPRYQTGKLRLLPSCAQENARTAFCIDIRRRALCIPPHPVCFVMMGHYFTAASANLQNGISDVLKPFVPCFLCALIIQPHFKTKSLFQSFFRVKLRNCNMCCCVWMRAMKLLQFHGSTRVQIGRRSLNLNLSSWDMSVSQCQPPTEGAWVMITQG